MEIIEKDLNMKEAMLLALNGREILLGNKIKHDLNFYNDPSVLDSWNISFFAQRTGTFHVKTVIHPYDIVPLNQGQCFSSSSGVFTVPFHGIYHFYFTALKMKKQESGTGRLTIQLVKNRKIVPIFREVLAEIHMDSADSYVFFPLQLQATAELQERDEITGELFEVNDLKLSRHVSTGDCITANGSDCHYKLGSSCSEGDFRCDNGHCIPMDPVCDEVMDCPDGTDEGDNCGNMFKLSIRFLVPTHSWSLLIHGLLNPFIDTPCEENFCEHNCVPGPKGPICYCEAGYRSENNGPQCVDIDECLSENRCSQYCANTEGDYDCSCAPGYYLEPDKYTCKVMDKRPLLIATSAHRVALLRNNNVTASHRDSITGNVYVSALVANQDRSVVKVVSHSLDADVDIDNSQAKITDIIIDGVRGALFWSEHLRSASGRIFRSTMDGKVTREIYYSGAAYPVALALNMVKTRIYWADKGQSISSCDYNGQQKKKLVVGRTNGLPLSLTFFENRISWTVWRRNVVYSQSVTGEPATSSLTALEDVHHLFTSHSILEPEYPNPYKSSSCGNGLCVLRNSSSFSCFCPTKTNVVSIAPFECSSRCPSHSFYCQPESECLPLSLVCSDHQDCDKLSDQDLCKSANKTISSEDIFRQTFLPGEDCNIFLNSP
ncbi:hypothetical protein DAPPUDRAFT_305193 [Daphnia pulex]|uniref:EGF-like domain-containing protein n=1 Tax=Daphnia pulex TaxID=6669 RepID=E9HVM5_DAPPU|nr:hypothetical protein DAPPUDRAFT_305193 [Daphnia pulex]|eukprot:EFX64194.1 hypothetical protein DAPPUDRAFT_305193 [Daphnia pulex]